MKQKVARWLRWAPALGWMVLIFLFSNQPGGESGNFSKIVLEWLASFGLDFRVWFGENAFFVIRKLAHFTEYFILFSLFLLAWGNIQRNGLRILLVTVVYAASDEFHQLFIPGRVGDWVDVGIDSLGALAAWLFWSSISWLLRKIK